MPFKLADAEHIDQATIAQSDKGVSHGVWWFLKMRSDLLVRKRSMLLEQLQNRPLHPLGSIPSSTDSRPSTAARLGVRELRGRRILGCISRPPFVLALAVACCVALAIGCGRKTELAVTQTATVVETVAAPVGAILMPRRDGELVYRPSMIALSEAATLSDVRWSSFGERRAVGRGTYFLNLCEPTCATAPREKVAADIDLARPARCRGHLAYTIITIEGPGMKVRNEPISLAINATRPACP